MLDPEANPPSSPDRAEALVDLDAIRTNVQVLRERTRAGIMAVVKADGYGHGILPSARAALAGGADYLGVAFVAEALALRAAGVDAPLLVMLVAPGTPVPRLVEAVSARVDLSVSSTWTLRDAVAAARVAGRPARVHLKADTGLSRGGAAWSEWPDLVTAAAKAQAADEVEVIGVWSHLACSDEPEHPANASQVAMFHDAVEIASRRGVVPLVRHLANSGGLLSLPETHLDMVRPGVAVYGLPPGPHACVDGLVPAMTLRSVVALTKQVPAGTGVSYGHAYRTSTNTRLALVPIGYADGVPRAAGNVVQVLLGRRRHRIAGRVCMDQFTVDVGDSEVSEGDEVLLFGSGRHGEPTAVDWASELGTIGYEIITRIGPRVPRRHTGGDGWS